LVGGLYPSISGGVAGAVLLVLAVGVSKVVHRMKKWDPMEDRVVVVINTKSLLLGLAGWCKP